jgi:L-aminopeptidase/D-esterase-like protein
MIEFPGLKIGHTTDLHHKTGVTLFLPDKPVRCGRWLCGAAPATRDCDLLAPEQMVGNIDALIFTGGSAFGLDAATGVMQWLKENGRGWPTHYGRVPIVPAAAIYDFQSPHPVVPTAIDAYHACTHATYPINLFGNTGVGTGATVGKLLPDTSPMAGGFGFAKLCNDVGLEVMAFAVVNCAGDVFQGDNIIAGARFNDGSFADTQKQLLKGKSIHSLIATHSNTTLVATFTNAKFDKTQLTRLARMASCGIAQAIRPVFTMFDGDMVFSLSFGNIIADEVVVGAMFAEASKQAIIKAVSHGENT